MTIMIGAFVGLHGVLCSRSTRSRRSEAENHQELKAGVREAAEILFPLLAIVSTGGAGAAVDGVQASRCGALRARVSPLAAELAECGACAASRHVLDSGA